jgi:hypothetical protein
MRQIAAFPYFHSDSFSFEAGNEIPTSRSSELLSRPSAIQAAFLYGLTPSANILADRLPQI